MFEDKLDTIGSLLQEDPTLGCFKYNGKICKTAHGKYNELLGTYCALIDMGVKVSLQQLSPEASAVVVGYDAKLDLEASVEFAKDLQLFFQQEYVLDSFSDNLLSCIVTVGDNTTQVHFPYIRVIREDYNNIHFYNLRTSLDENPDLINLMTRDFVPMYGSDDQEYLCCLQDIGLLDTEEPTLQEILLNLEEFSHMNHTKVEFAHSNSSALTSHEYPEMTETMWLPLILSTDYWRTITRKKDKSREVEIEFRCRERNYPDLEAFKYFVPIVDVPWTDEEHTMFVNMWEPNRVFSPIYWTDVGRALRTFWIKDPRRGLTHWVEILRSTWDRSRKDQKALSPDMVRRTCTSLYKTFLPGEVDIHTLAWYARIDSPVDYYKWHDSWFMPAFVSSLRSTHRDMARAFYRMYWLDIISMKGDKSDLFFTFSNHRLTRDYGGSYVKTLMNNDFLLQYNRLRADLGKSRRETVVGQEVAKQVFLSIEKAIDSLGNYGFKTKVLQELADMFRVDNLINYMDQNRELTLLKNGVMVVAGGDLHFREGKPQDYLSKSFGGSYNEEYSWDHPDVEAALEWATITFVDPDTISFFWKFMASMFLGGNNDKKLAFFAGPLGNNMKTTWQNQIALVIGERCISMPINYFTMGKGKADGATPSTIRLAEGCRLMFSEEPEENVPILTSVAKAEVGNEKKYVRGNYQEGRDITPQHKVIIVCNFIPPIHKEPAMQERVIVFPFESQAIYGAPTDRETQMKTRKFPRDPDFNTKLGGMVDANTWIMKQTFHRYWEERLRDPPADVTRITNDYWDSIDRYTMFYKDYIVEDPTDSIDSFDLFNKFSKWHQSTYKKLDIPDKSKVIEAMSHKFGLEPVDGMWHGFGIKVRNSTNS
jgi:hypothetical protein